MLRFPKHSWCSTRGVAGCGNHALVDGNERLAWAATAVFLVLNDRPPRPDQDAVFQLVMDVAGGDFGDLGEIATRTESLL